MKYLRTAQMNARTRRVCRTVRHDRDDRAGAGFRLGGRAGYRRGGHSQGGPVQSGGIDKALLTLRNQPFGEFLMMLVALGLVVFGVYGLCEARWRKVLAQRDYGPAREGNLAWLMLPPRCQEM